MFDEYTPSTKNRIASSAENGMARRQRHEWREKKHERGAVSKMKTIIIV